MTIIKYIVLGIVQGLTEFLPVSSSAHLVIFQEVFHIQEHQLMLDIVLHMGTLMAVIVFLWKDIKRLVSEKMLFLVFLATVLTSIIVLLGFDFFEKMFLSVKNVALPLTVTGLVLMGTKRFSKGERTLPQLQTADAVWLGIMQGLAVIPGLSRSGITIATLLFRNVEKETAFKFSFLVSILAILGALFLKMGDFSHIDSFELKYMLFGFGAAFFSGLLALKILFVIIRRAQLHLFGFYCIALAIVLWII